jgi:hypothetical protein
MHSPHAYMLPVPAIAGQMTSAPVGAIAVMFTRGPKAQIDHTEVLSELSLSKDQAQQTCLRKSELTAPRDFSWPVRKMWAIVSGFLDRLAGQAMEDELAEQLKAVRPYNRYAKRYVNNRSLTTCSSRYSRAGCSTYCAPR